MVRTLKRMTRKIRRSKGGGTKRRLRGGDVKTFLNTKVDLGNGIQKFKEFFTAKPTQPSVLETVASATKKVASSAPVTAIRRLAPGASTGGSRRRRRRNKTKKP
tara:strand:- start:507 stop:818 length:312 start_codon:yes stop_codon:yes gene_type:complete